MENVILKGEKSGKYSIDFLSVLGIKYFYIFSWEVNHENQEKIFETFFSNLNLAAEISFRLLFFALNLP